MSAILPKHAVSQIVGYIKGKRAIHLARGYGERKRNFGGQHFWTRGYLVSTVGRDEAVIREYIRNQEKEDARLEQLGLWRRRGRSRLQAARQPEPRSDPARRFERPNTKAPGSLGGYLPRAVSWRSHPVSVQGAASLRFFLPRQRRHGRAPRRPLVTPACPAP